MKRIFIFLFITAALRADTRIGNDMLQVEITNLDEALWMYHLSKSDFTQNIAPPVLEINGEPVTGLWTRIDKSQQMLYNGIIETTISGPVKGHGDVHLALKVRVSQDNPVVRFQYVLSSENGVELTKTAGADRIRYLGASLASFPRVTQVRLTEYDELVHCYLPAERVVEDRYFDNNLAVDGPILVAENDAYTFLMAYEHGSQLPDRYVEFQLDKSRDVVLNAGKGNYWGGQPIKGIATYETLWFDVAAVQGDKEAIAAQFRTHVLKYMSPNLTSREPYIFYNTWNYQERNQAWNGKPYLASMNLERMLKEIDIAHEMGIDVFVIDTGWYQKTGDWQVSLERFPDTLQTVRAKLDEYDMKLGLWFNAMAATSSDILQKNKDNIVRWNGDTWGPRAVWETEDSYPMCFVSSFWEDYADELIRLVDEVGVTYFKWDAIGQYGCNEPGHFHGDESATPQERSENYSFLLARYMGKVIDKLCAACPEAIVDFDITEGERAVGLQFLASGKYFIINNGPYYQSFDDLQYAPGGGMGANVFVWPGPARARLCREALNYDKWIPSVLFLTHYLPDDPLTSQYFNIGSLILGQNGIWGDLPSISEQGIQTFKETMDLYKQVKYDITSAPPVRKSRIGGVPEIHEKINPETGKGAVVLFFSYKSPWIKLADADFGGTFEYVTEHAVDQNLWTNENVDVNFDEHGRAHIKATFHGPEAKILFFGVNE
ncbi:alpha-galactosidase [candidate division KSB1 bacterium]|nr:alpha-galactosidase [candidate division KSB1 bacterium]